MRGEDFRGGGSIPPASDGLFAQRNTVGNFFLTLTSFPAQIRDFKNLKGIWHQMLARSSQLQVIFGFLKPLFHVQILD